MIDKIEVQGSGYKVDEMFTKYVNKRLAKLDRYLPRGMKKDAVIKLMVTKIGTKNKGDKFEISATMNITGGKEMIAKDECTNVLAGVDLIEAKLTGQIRRYKLEVQPHRQKRNLKDLFIKRK